MVLNELKECTVYINRPINSAFYGSIEQIVPLGLQTPNLTNAPNPWIIYLQVTGKPGDETK